MIERTIACEISVDFPPVDSAPEGVRADETLRARWKHAREELAFVEAIPQIRRAFTQAGVMLDSTIPKPSRHDVEEDAGRVIEARMPPALETALKTIPGVRVRRVQAGCTQDCG